MKITYKVGDVCAPSEQGRLVIVHCCNDLVPGVMGAGVALSIRNKWERAYRVYKDWSSYGTNLWYSTAPVKDVYLSNNQYRLGEIQLVKVEDNITICNLIGQRGINYFHDIAPIRYKAIEEGLWKLRNRLDEQNYIKQIISPMFGAGLAGGDWNIIENMIYDIFNSYIGGTTPDTYNWTVYCLNKKDIPNART